jgi:arabinofuranan 3-O-arabinosyltransferase
MESLDIAAAPSVPATLSAPERLAELTRIAGRCWIPLAALLYAFDLSQQTRQALTNGAGRPFGDDFLNYWSAPFLAWRGRAAEIYDFPAFHAFQQGVVGAHLDYYHYSYPPLTLLLTAPLAALAYVPALFVWLVVSWYAFYRALLLAAPRGGLILSLALPAFLVNAIGGQNGAWTAALLGGGLCLLQRRPVAAGILFGLMAYKPHLALLVPVALLAGRQWRAIIAAGLTAGALALASALIFGADMWSGYLHNANVLRVIILEDGTGVWHRMMSVFVFARHIGFGVDEAYAAQAAMGLLAAAVVALAWARRAPSALLYALLLLGTCLATPYLQDYDLVFGAFIVAWLVRPEAPATTRQPLMIASALAALAPFAAAPLAKLTGIATGPLFFAPAFAIVAYAVFTGEAELVLKSSPPPPLMGNRRPIGSRFIQAVDARAPKE